MFNKIRMKSRIRSFVCAGIMVLAALLLFWIFDNADIDGHNFVFMLVIAMFAALAGYMIYRGITCPNMKDIEEYCSKHGNKALILNRLEAFYKAAPPVNGLRIDGEYFMCISNGINIDFAETREILWAYFHVTKNSYSGIPTGKTYAIQVMLTDGSSFRLNQKNKKKADETMQYISNSIPYIIFGYDNQLADVYANNRQEMIQAVNARRTEYMANRC
ncbi:MAG: DUF6709 family protein [Coprococcus sp.]